ncbi:MAG: zinc-dependent alcohol dehydrogenase family protein [Gammaproteobacteria bacterium]
MLAISINETGSADILKAVEIDTPSIGTGTQVKVRIHAAGVNPVDTKFRAGANTIQHFPFIPGCDGAGEVIEVGSDVSRFKTGDAVYYFHGGISGIQGNYAEYAIIDERFLVKKPKQLDYYQAAAAPLVLLTAWESLFDRASLAEGQTVFINAGAGGVGHVAIQLAKSVGAKVCTTVSNDEKAAFVKELGADHAINYKRQGVIEQVNDWTDGEGVDVALDNIGGRETQMMFSLTKTYGHVVSLLLPDRDLDWTIARQRNLSFSLEVMLTPQAAGLVEAQKHQTAILEKCAELFDTGQLKVHVSEVLPLDQAAHAHHMIEEGHTTGKVVLDMQVESSDS